MTLPECDRCDGGSLDAVRAENGVAWCVCRACAKTCLVKNGVIVHHGT